MSDKAKAALITKKLYSITEEFTNHNASPTKPHEELKAPEFITFIIEYLTDKTFKVEIPLAELPTCTTSQLFVKSFNKLVELVGENSPDIHIESIVALQTKKKDLMKDYYLTLPEKVLNFLEDETVLTYYHKTFLINTVEESPIEARISLKDFEVLAKLGSGGFATVYLVRWKKNGRFYALKQMDKGMLSAEDKKALLRERNAMFELKEAFLVHLHTAFQTAKYCYLVLDFLPGGDLLHVLSKFKRFSENTCKHIVAEILLGLKKIHEKNYIYRDLKIENILLDSDGHVHICDFGLTKKVNEIHDLNYSLCGTPEFLAPEVYLETGYNYLVDIYAIGPMLYELVTGSLPFETDNLLALKMKIIKAKPAIPSYVTPELQDFLDRIFEKEPKNRLGSKSGVKEVMMHPWFKGFDWYSVEKKKKKMPFTLNLEKRRFKTVPLNFNVEDPGKIAILDLVTVDEESKKENAKRVACFSYYSPLQKAKQSQRKEHSDIRSAKMNLQKRGGGETLTNKSDKTKDEDNWLGDFDRDEVDEAEVGQAFSKQKLSPYVLNTKVKLMSQVKFDKHTMSSLIAAAGAEPNKFG